jgi:hypothetical protein
VSRTLDCIVLTGRQEFAFLDIHLFVRHFISVSHFITFTPKFYFNFLWLEEAGNFAGKVFE